MSVLPSRLRSTASCPTLQRPTLPCLPAAFLRLTLSMVPIVLLALVAARVSLAQGSALLVPSSSATLTAGSGAMLEMPVLVVDHEHRPVQDLPLAGLKIKTGNGVVILPSAIRRELEDPISVAILLDASRDSWHDLSQVGEELAGLVGSQFLPQDRISLYVFDCALTRSLTDVVPEAAVLRKGVADAMTFPSLHGGEKYSACAKTVHLWDDVATAVARLSRAPGRRVVLLISSGVDGGSKNDVEALQQYAFDQGVAIFALRDKRQVDADDFTQTGLSVTRGHDGPSISPTVSPRKANALELLCVNDGGITLSSEPQFRKDAIADILFLVRQRFILTLPKEAYPAGGAHSAKVTPRGLNPAFFTATGAGTPLVVKTP